VVPSSETREVVAPHLGAGSKDETN
jgi:hypothetical protein